MHTQTVSVRDGMFSTQLLSAGSGPPLVFLHGASGLPVATPALDRLAERFTVYAPAHPGWNDSTGLEHLDDIHDLTTYYLDLFDTLGLDGPAVIGHSFGGWLAAELAARCAGAVSKLVLAAPIGLWRDDQPVADIFTLAPDDLRAASWHEPEGDVARRYTTMPEDQAERTAVLLTRTQALAATGKFIWPIPDKGLSKRIHRVKAPTLLLWGASDALVPVVYAEEFRARLRDARVQVLPDASHQLLLEQPEACTAAISAFLAG